MELKDTVKFMNSENYKERFKGEYYQLKIRLEKLHKMIIKMEAGCLDFYPSSSIGIHKEQEKHMNEYLHILEIRAEMEHINL